MMAKMTGDGWKLLLLALCCVVMTTWAQSAGQLRATLDDTTIADIIKDGMILRRLKRNLQSVDHKWGFIDVRPECHMFYWLYYTTHPQGWNNRPLVLWLQGGPGAGSSGFGNFDMIGNLDTNGNKRRTSWLQEANLLFVDAPLGAGFSYTDKSTLYSTDIDGMADDLVAFMKIFMAKHSHLQNVPLFVFGQSYGGKLAAVFAEKVSQFHQSNNIDFSVDIVALGNSWISAVDSTLQWPHLLYYMAHVDDVSREELVSSVEEVKKLVEEGQWLDATVQWVTAQQRHFQHAPWLDIYNVMNFDLPATWLSANGSRSTRSVDELKDIWRPASSSSAIKQINDFMNGPVRMYLIEKGASEDIEFGGAKFNDLFLANLADFMSPVVTTIDTLLNNSSVKVVVYQGQLDVICNTAGALAWINRLNSSKMVEFHSAPRVPAFYSLEGQVHVIAKKSSNLDMYWIMHAGHAVPKDAPDAGLWLLQHLIQQSPALQ